MRKTYNTTSTLFRLTAKDFLLGLNEPVHINIEQECKKCMSLAGVLNAISGIDHSYSFGSMKKPRTKKLPATKKFPPLTDYTFSYEKVLVAPKEEEWLSEGWENYPTDNSLVIELPYSMINKSIKDFFSPDAEVYILTESMTQQLYKPT